MMGEMKQIKVFFFLISSSCALSGMVMVLSPVL